MRSKFMRRETGNHPMKVLVRGFAVCATICTILAVAAVGPVNASNFHGPTFPPDDGTIVAHGPTLPPDDGTIIAHGPTLPPDDGTIIAHGPTLPPDDGTIIAHGPTLPPDDGTIIAHGP